MLARDTLKAVGEPLTLQELTLEMKRIKEFSMSSTPEGSVQMALRRELAAATRLNQTPEINKSADGKFYLSEWHESRQQRNLARNEEVGISEVAKKAKLSNPIQNDLETANTFRFSRGEKVSFRQARRSGKGANTSQRLCMS